MSRFAQFGNDLYTGKRSIDFVGRTKLWYAISAVAVALAVAGLLLRGLSLGIEFTGGSEFRVSNISVSSTYESTATVNLAAALAASGLTVERVAPGTEPSVTKLGANTVRVQTEKLDDATSAEVRQALGSAFKAPESDVSANFIGPSWGESVSKQALRALLVFLVLVGVVMAIYFRTWKMAVAAATMIGFLTVLGYSLYDTVVVFDKVRENTTEALANQRMSYAAAANLAVNQTLVRSINTTVVALLPIAAVLVLAFTRLGPGTLLDLTLSLFIGMAVGAYSSIFIASPLLVHLRSREPEIVKLAKAAARHDGKVAASAAKRAARAEANAVPATAGVAAGTGAPVATGARGSDSTARPAASAVRPAAQRAADAADPRTPDDVLADGETGTLTGRKVHKWAQAGPRNQPKRPPKSKR